MPIQPIRTAIIGCGNVAGSYASNIKHYPEIELIGFYDIIPERATQFAEQYGGKAYPSLEELLADAGVELVVNLTIHSAHVEIIRRCLLAGKHVHTEKPMALDGAEARALVALADEQGLRLSSAPITYMGEAQQTAWRCIREGKLGTVRLIYAEVNHGRIEIWHPNPEPFYQVGVLWDVSVYPLTLLTTFFGPITAVSAFGRVLYPDRVTNEGRPFHISAPDYSVISLELANGAIARLTANFYVRGGKQGSGLEFHGDIGSLYLSNFQQFNASVEYADYGESYQPVPLLRPPFEGTEYSRGVQELAIAMQQGRPQRATGAQAAHVIDVLCAIHQSMREGQRVSVTSTFTPPIPMDWALEPAIA